MKQIRRVILKDNFNTDEKIKKVINETLRDNLYHISEFFDYDVINWDCHLYLLIIKVKE